MKLAKRRLDQLHPDPRNARTHSEANLAAITSSLRLFGQRRAAVVRSDGTILAGNGMYEAAKRLGIEELHVHIVPDEWTDDEARAFALADNRTAELAEWDQEILAQHLVELDLSGIDLTDLGFATRTHDPKDGPEDFDAYDDDIETQHQCPKCGYEWSGASS